MSHASFKNIGAYIKVLRSASAQAVAAGTGDATETNGATVDRGGPGGMAMSAVFILSGTATLAAGKKATFKATLQHDTDSAAGSMVDAAAANQFEGAADSVVLTLTDGGAGGTQSGLYTEDLDLSALNRYIRAQVHIDLDASGTDTGHYQSLFVLGGYDVLPQS